MPYININEYDKTIMGPQTYTGDVVAIPINASDGPSDKWVTCYTYEDFMQIYGPNPATGELFGNSWEYAASLLLRGMPVCVRRITHELDENGNNTSSPLKGLSTARCAVKVKDILGKSTLNAGSLKEYTIDVTDIAGRSKLYLSDAGVSQPNEDYVEYTMITASNLEIKGNFNSVYELNTHKQALEAIKISIGENDITATPGKFADVKDDGLEFPFIESNHEWRSVATARVNNHYKNTKYFREQPSAHNFFSMQYNEIMNNTNGFDSLTKKDNLPSFNTIIANDTIYEASMPTTFNEFAKGDFFIDNKNNRIDYVPEGYENPHRYDNTNIMYADQLKNIEYINVKNEKINKDSFVTTIFDKNAKQTKKPKVWEFTNCKFLNNLEEFTALSSEQKREKFDDKSYVLIINNTYHKQPEKIEHYQSDSAANILFKVEYFKEEGVSGVRLNPLIQVFNDKSEITKESLYCDYFELDSSDPCTTIKNIREAKAKDLTYLTNLNLTKLNKVAIFDKILYTKDNLGGEDNKKIGTVKKVELNVYDIEINKQASSIDNLFTIDAADNKKAIETFEEVDEDNNPKFVSIDDVLNVVVNHLFLGEYSEDKFNEFIAYNDDNIDFNGSFAVIKKDNNTRELYQNINGNWNYTQYNVDSVYKFSPIVPGNNIGNLNLTAYQIIPWKETEHSLDENIYRVRYYWKNTEKSEYYTMLLWDKSDYEIGHTYHEVISDASVRINDININTAADVNKTTITVGVNNFNDIQINSDYAGNRLVSGKFGFCNISYRPIKIYSLRIFDKVSSGLNLIYDSGLEKISSASDTLVKDSLFKIKLVDGTEYNADLLEPMLDMTNGLNKWYFEIPAGATIYYNKNLTNAQFKLSMVTFDVADLQIYLMESINGRYELNLSAVDRLEVNKWAIPEISDEKENLDDLPITDFRGNFNLFIADYLYPGIAGNLLNIRIKTLKTQGIYAYVYNKNQYLERIELCSFREKNNSTGRVTVLDLETNKLDIWRKILAKFSIYLSDENFVGNEKTALPKPIYGSYVKLNLNYNLVNFNSLDYADALFAQTGSQLAYLSGGSNPDDQHVLHEVSKSFVPLKDKYRYDISFIASGGYIDELIYSSDLARLNYNGEFRLIEDAMLDVANSRQDCVAYLDVPYDLAVEDVPFYFEHISTSYAAAYDPWCQLALPTGGYRWMPPSFIQLYTHAKSIANGNKMYLPPAGVNRALVPEIVNTNHLMSSSYITDWQNTEAAQFINPIIWINGFDYTIYGQKTLYNIVNQSDIYTSALQNLNVRLVANIIKKLIFKTCISLTFELNNIMTWNEFKAKIEPVLNEMQSAGVLNYYQVLMGTETMTRADLNTGHVVGTVRVAITSAAIDWDINFEITPNELTLNEYNYNSTYSL